MLWQLGAMGYSTVVLPSPVETWMALQRLAIAGKLTHALLITSFHLFSAFAIAVLLGVIAGIGAGIWPGLRWGISPLISALQGIPPIGWIVLALLWFGSGHGTPIFTITAAVLPIVFLGTVEGMQRFPLPLAEMAQIYRAPDRLLLVDLYFPHLLSYLFPALTAGLGLAWRVAVMAELLSSETGIGAELNLARINLETDEVMAWIAIAVFSIWICEYLLLRPLRRWLEPWQHGDTPKNSHRDRPSSR
ncbi:MAG: ABC transporter permease subunit [Cyanobacteria bacterium SBLK]|nr:ABC transporter permease subunit [Cyanobacteria bacterium SBLK]